MYLCLCVLKKYRGTLLSPNHADTEKYPRIRTIPPRIPPTTRTMRTRSALFAAALLCACALPGALGSDGGHDEDDHVPAACREFGYPESGWQLDIDCCAPYYQSACADGYDHDVTDEVCFKSGDCMAYSTICTLSDALEKVTMSSDVENYECELEVDLTEVIIAIAIIVPLLVGCCVSGCYCTKTCCFLYRRREQFGGITVAPGVQMGGMPTAYTIPAAVQDHRFSHSYTPTPK